MNRNAHPIRPARFSYAVPLLALLGTLAVARADGGKEAPRIVGSMTAAPYQRIEQFAKRIGLSLPPQFSPAAIEAMFPFIGQGGAATDEPMGAFVVGSDALASDKSFIAAIPVTAKAADLKGLVAKGATRVESSQDMVTMNGVPLKRTGDYLWFGGTPDLLAVQDAAALAALYADGKLLASATVDMQAIRKVMPQRFAEFLKQQQAETKAPANANERFGQELVFSAMRDGLHRLEMTAAADAHNFDLNVTFEPATLKNSGSEFAKPGLPEGVLFRVDVAYPSIDVAAKLADFLVNTGYEEDVSNRLKAAGAGADVEQVRRDALAEKAFTGQIVHLVTEADALTMSLSVEGGVPVYYQVNQYRDDFDFKGAAAKFIAAAAKKQGGGDSVKSETYATADGTTVTRVRWTEGGKESAFIDYVQRGKQVFLTFSPNKNTAIEKLLSLRGQDRMPAVAAGFIDVGATFDTFKAMAGPNAPLLPDMMAGLEKATRGQKITFAAEPTSKGGSVRLIVPLELPKQLIGLFMGQ